MKSNHPIVIKFGGEIVENQLDLSNLLSSITDLHKSGEKIILVHGGGPLATNISDRMNLKTIKVGGRRVTDQATLDIMKMTLPGIINSNILAMMKEYGLPGVSVSGISIIDCHKRPPRAVSGSEGEIIDFGFVGDIDHVNTLLLTKLLDSHFIPVISPLCADKNGIQLNINADTVSVQIAKYTSAKKIVLITKIGGVYEDIDNPTSKFSSLKLDEAKDIISSGVIKEGMIPKLEEGFKLFSGDLDVFHIVGVETKDTLKNEISYPGSEGTAIFKN